MILFHSVSGFNLKTKRLYKRWLSELAKSEGCKIGEVNYIFCDDDYLLPLNIQYLQHDTLTDIITFDNSEGKLLHGDIYISVERVQDNAADFGVSFDDELVRVLAHGVLHLCGYKDKKEEEAAVMREKENAAIALFYSVKNSLIN